MYKTKFIDNVWIRKAFDIARYRTSSKRISKCILGFFAFLLLTDIYIYIEHKPSEHIANHEDAVCMYIWQNPERMNEMQTTSKTNLKTTEKIQIVKTPEKNFVVYMKSERESRRDWRKKKDPNRRYNTGPNRIPHTRSNNMSNNQIETNSIWLNLCEIKHQTWKM